MTATGLLDEVDNGLPIEYDDEIPPAYGDIPPEYEEDNPPARKDDVPDSSTRCEPKGEERTASERTLGNTDDVRGAVLPRSIDVFGSEYDVLDSILDELGSV